MDYTVPLHWWLLLLFSLTYGSSFAPSFFHFLHPYLPLCIYSSLFLRRPQAGDDLRFLADGLAGELLQYCHDHQAGGSGKGKVHLTFCPVTSSTAFMKTDEAKLYLTVFAANFMIYYISEELCFLAFVAAVQGQSFDGYEVPWGCVQNVYDTKYLYSLEMLLAIIIIFILLLSLWKHPEYPSRLKDWKQSGRNNMVHYLNTT